MQDVPAEDESAHRTWTTAGVLPRLQDHQATPDGETKRKEKVRGETRRQMTAPHDIPSLGTCKICGFDVIAADDRLPAEINSRPAWVHERCLREVRGRAIPVPR